MKDDPKSIASSDLPKLEKPSITTTESLSPKKKRRSYRVWFRYLEIGIGTIGTGILGITIHQFMNLSQANLSNSHSLDRYLEAHWYGLSHLETNEQDLTELELYLLGDDESSEDI